MESTVYFLIAIIFVLVTARNLCIWIDVLAHGNYKITALFKQKSTFRKLVFNTENILKLILFGVFFTTTFSYSLIDTFPFLVGAVYALSFFHCLREFFSGKLRFPYKNIPIFCISLFVLSLDVFILQFPLFDKYFWFLCVEKLSPFFLLICIVGYSVFSDFYRDIEINRAIQKISKRPDLQTILIIGDGYVDIVQDMISKCLSSRYNVITYLEDDSSLISIARFVNASLTPKTNSIVIRSSAFQKAHIQDICSLLPIKTCIITGSSEISPIKAKSVFKTYELLESQLERKTQYILNADDPLLSRAFDKKKHLVEWFSSTKKHLQKTAVTVHVVKKGRITTTLRLSLGTRKGETLRLPFIGKEYLQSLYSVALTAKHMGFTYTTLKKTLEKLSPYPARLEPYITANRAYGIRDTKAQTFSSYTDGIQTCEQHRRKKYAVITPLNTSERNLGKLHYQLGFLVGSIFDTVYLTSREYFSSIKKGVADSNGTCIVSLASEKTIQSLYSKLHTDDVVLFEGEGAEKYFQMLESESVY